jgi:tetratricopeptide (TPR) repeat protein
MPGILHVELVEQTATALQLRLWRDNPNAPRTRTLELAEIGGLVGKAETDYYSPLPAKLQEVGQALFCWLDGGERWLSAEIQAADPGDVLVLAIDLPHGLAHLPWEVLHDGTGFLVHAPNPPVLPVRWNQAATPAIEPANRPLQALFMASSPENVQPMLEYEQEEHEILEATEHSSLDLVVEESGSLEELGRLVQDYGKGFFDVLHLTGHANHAEDDTPVFVLEDSEGQRADATPAEFVKRIPHRPPLVFLSGCRTGQAAKHGEVRSFAEQLIDKGFRAVLGWGRPVRDAEATLAATLVYQNLAAGESLPLALVRAHAELHDSGVRDWHLLRLFCAGDPPAAFVTPVMTPGRKRPAVRPAESEFLDLLTGKVKVATRASFVGRRRLLQRSLRELRRPVAPRVGLLLQGQGGRGKSSVAARLCDRLRAFERVVVIGRLDEPSLIKAWVENLPDNTSREALRDPGGGELRYRIRSTLESLASAGRAAPLFVLDDFEQNQPNAADGDLTLAQHTADVLLPLLEALADTGNGRVLITCRYALPAPFSTYLQTVEVPPLDATEQRKQSLRLDQKAARQTKDPDLLAQAFAAADGNPRLFEWLHAVLERPGLDHAGILAEMQKAEEKFRENILARHLIASLPGEDRVLLGRMLLLSEPVPLAAMHALDPARDEAGVREALGRAATLGLVDVTEADGQRHYRVPRQLGGGDPPLLQVTREKERADLAGAVFDVLHRVWWAEMEKTPENRMLELIRLAAEAGRKGEVVDLVSTVTTSWLRTHRYAETSALLEPLLLVAERHPALLVDLGRARQMLGHGEEAGSLLKEAVAGSAEFVDKARASILLQYTIWLYSQGELDEVVRISRDEVIPLLAGKRAEGARAVTWGRIADVLESRGELEETLRIRREEELPVYERLGDMRARAMALAKIADVLAARGEFDEALKIYNKEALPAFTQLGDVRSWAVTLGKIADVLAVRGEVEEAQRIRLEEELPMYERLGDVRMRAVTLGKIADVLAARGELEEALRIQREEQLPVFERLGEVRERAVTLGKIAEALATQGELEEAVRILREEQLPMFTHLNAVRDLVVGRVNIAILLVRRGRKEDGPEVVEHLVWAYQAAAPRGYVEAAQIAEIMGKLGIPLPEQV